MVTCPNCETQNIDGVRFCVQCGTALAPPLESWRGTGEVAAPQNPAPPPPSSNPQGTGGYTPPYAAPSYDTPQTPPMFAAPLPAMSYGTHAPTAFGGGGELQYAEWGQRFLGYLVDFVISMVLSVVIFVPFSIVAGIGGGNPNEMSGVQCFGTALMYAVSIGFGIFNQIWLRGTRGSTIGQGVLGLKTVTAEGEIPSFGSLIIRLLVQIPIGLVLCIGPVVDYLFPLWDEKKQTLHDKAAGTFVVKA
jgi:uncharacterized RDD family membrane protein YckC